jgi:glutamate-1-semialdehyde 2,1-aminomutase
LRKLTPQAFQQLNEHGAYVRDHLTRLLDQTGVPGQVTGQGSLFGLRLGEREARDFRGWYGTEEERARRSRVYSDLLARGVLVAPHLVGCVSTPMTRDDLDRLIDAVGEAIAPLG